MAALMKRRYLMYDPHRKFFTNKTLGTIPRLLTPEEEVFASEYENSSSYHHQEGELEIYMNWVLVYGHWF